VRDDLSIITFEPQSVARGLLSIPVCGVAAGSRARLDRCAHGYRTYSRT